MEEPAICFSWASIIFLNACPVRTVAHSKERRVVERKKHDVKYICSIIA